MSRKRAQSSTASKDARPRFKTAFHTDRWSSLGETAAGGRAEQEELSQKNLDTFLEQQDKRRMSFSSPKSSSGKKHNDKARIEAELQKRRDQLKAEEARKSYEQFEVLMAQRRKEAAQASQEEASQKAARMRRLKAVKEKARREREEEEKKKKEAVARRRRNAKSSPALSPMNAFQPKLEKYANDVEKQGELQADEQRTKQLLAEFRAAVSRERLVARQCNLNSIVDTRRERLAQYSSAVPEEVPPLVKKTSARRMLKRKGSAEYRRRPIRKFTKRPATAGGGKPSPSQAEEPLKLPHVNAETERAPRAPRVKKHKVNATTNEHLMNVTATVVATVPPPRFVAARASQVHADDDVITPGPGGLRLTLAPSSRFTSPASARSSPLPRIPSGPSLPSNALDNSSSGSHVERMSLGNVPPRRSRKPPPRASRTRGDSGHVDPTRAASASPWSPRRRPHRHPSRKPALGCASAPPRTRRPHSAQVVPRSHPSRPRPSTSDAPSAQPFVQWGATVHSPQQAAESPHKTPPHKRRRRRHKPIIGPHQQGRSGTREHGAPDASDASERKAIDVHYSYYSEEDLPVRSPLVERLLEGSRVQRQRSASSPTSPPFSPKPNNSSREGTALFAPVDLAELEAAVAAHNQRHVASKKPSRLRAAPAERVLFAL